MQSGKESEFMELTDSLRKGLLDCVEVLYIIEEASRTVVFCSGVPSRHGSEQTMVGEKCFRAFLGRDQPCPFCPDLREESTEDKPYTWDYLDPFSGQWMKVKNRLVNSGGVCYRVGNANAVSDMMGLGSDAVREVGLMQRLVRERNQVWQQLLHELSHDRLTGLFNRNQYIRDLEGRYREIGACGVLFFDLNNLKEANDRFYHSEGDRLLCRLADSLRTASEDRGRCYRVGGDEFLLIWVDCTQEELETCREQVLRELQSRDRGQCLACSVAVGSAWNSLVENVEQLVSQADRRMYEEKRRIKGHGTK